MSKRIKPKGLKLSERRQDVYKLRKRFIIVCEGEKTEPNYFSRFRVPKQIISIIGLGANTVTVVEKAIEERNRNRSAAFSLS